MRTPLIVANWKMNTALADAVVLAQTIKNGIEDLENVEIVLCPPSVWLYPLAEVLEKVLGKWIKLGAQNIHWQDEGPFTGEISAKMLKKLCEYVIVGHSERRHWFHEDNEMVNDKVHAALRNGLKPIICVGEYRKMHEAKRGRGRPTKVEVGQSILHQLVAGLEHVSPKEIEKVVIAYEPVWAISTTDNAQAADGAYANAVINSLREKIFRLYNWDTASQIRILYGGSVDSRNIIEFIRQPEIDGVLVGGGSLRSKEFINICRETAQ